MIRKLREADIAAVAGLWLDTNLKAHGFVPAEYWRSNYEPVKAMLPEAEVYVYENAGETAAFIGMNGEYIEGIFVSDKMRSRGIGKLLLDHVKAKKDVLRLNVYQKNERAVRFYKREGFEICDVGTDEATGEKDYTMIWRRTQP